MLTVTFFPSFVTVTRPFASYVNRWVTMPPTRTESIRPAVPTWFCTVGCPVPELLVGCAQPPYVIVVAVEPAWS
ncbi:MAG: hypothetical protein ACYC2K_07210, partial [Gemmatimonadales bacterium]